MAKRYNSRVRHRDFQVGDLVLRKVKDATKDTSGIIRAASSVAIFDCPKAGSLR